jgi:uncharacterized protein DUF6714
MELRASLLAAFPAAPLSKELLAEPTNYEEHHELATLAGTTWRDITTAFLVRHASLLVYASPSQYRALLPAYLLYLVEHDAFNEVPFQVARQLTRKDDPTDQQIFDRRIAGLDAAQRAVVRRVIEHLATKEPMQEPMSRALASWQQLD